MNMYEELARLQHYGREDIVQDLEQHLRCWYCEKVLTDKELKLFDNVCESCEKKREGINCLD
jgi:Zn finger protein HypA/HybF involved in hydrogenase expression